MADKDYSLYSIEQDLISELEDNKEEILNTQGDYLYEYVEGHINKHYRDRIMIFAKNSELWGRSTKYTAGKVYEEATIQDQITGVIYEHLESVAQEWLDRQIWLEEQEA